MNLLGGVRIGFGGNSGGGGTGGKGGTGGRGGTGGLGGTGGAGSGGTVSLIGTVTAGSGVVDVSGGSAEAGNGRFIVGNNAAGTGGDVVREGVGMEITTEGPKATNPHFFGDLSGGFSPTLPGLKGGAEGFGLVNARRSDLTLSGELEALLDPGIGLGTILRLDRAFAGEGLDDLAYDFVGFDLVLISVHARDGLINPRLGFGGEYNETGNLMEGGWSRDAAFGGTGDDLLPLLTNGDIYVTLVPETVTSLTFSANGIGAMSFDAFGNGELAYIGQSAVPVPAAVWLLASAVAGVCGAA